MRIKVVQDWEQLSELLEPVKGSIIILGDVDTGKSTLVEHICSSMKKKREIGLISADLGQSLFGLPACFSYARITHDNIRELQPEKMIFVGSCSPRGNFLKVIIAFQKLLKYAQKQTSFAVIDTDGLVQDNTGKEYKVAMIQMVDKGMVIGIQKEHELEHILKYLKSETNIPVALIKILPEAQNKSQQERTDYRTARFQSYFKDGIEKIYEINYDRITGSGFGIGKIMDKTTLEVLSKYFDVKVLYGEYGKYEFSVILEQSVDKEALSRVASILNIRKLSTYSVHDFNNLLVGFNDNHGYSKIIGLIKEFRIAENQLLLYLPYDEEISSLACILGKEHFWVHGTPTSE